jgi:putative membrane-bound dehydrogenase-like protein
MRHTLLSLVLAGASAFTLHAQAPKKKGISVAEPPPDTSPEAELASFRVLNGFTVNLFASEADGVPNPLVVRWDERGRLWTISTTSYPQPAPGEATNDKILILEDTNQDGRADKVTTFAEGLRMPTGLELAGPGEVYVGEGEKLWLLKDTDGDDRVDQKEVIFSGFGTGDTHQNINSFVWSPDGALIMHQGLHCCSRVATPWGVRQLYGSGFWRFWPRSRKLEPYPTGMPANAWGTAFTRLGQPLMIAGAAGMFWARPMEISVPEIETGNSQPYFLLTRFMLPHSGQIIKTEGLRKFCGIDLVGNTHWPHEMQEELITGGFFENSVFRYQIVGDSENPSGFEAVEQPPLITSTHVAFRPIDVKFGPEGALYVADWYNPIIGHYQASFRHPNRDKTHGRIWRVCAKNALVRQEHAVSIDTSASGLWKITAENDRWHAYQARRLLNALHPTVAPAAVGVADLRLNVQWHETNEAPDEAVLQRALADPQATEYATHAIGNWAGHLPDALEPLRRQIMSDQPRVRLEAIVACAKVRQTDAIKVALMALEKPMDSFLDRTLWLAVHGTSPQWKKADQPAELAAFLAGLPPRHLAYLVEKDGTAEVLGAVREMLKKESLPEDTARALTLALLKSGGESDILQCLQLGMKDAGLLQQVADAVMQRRGNAPGGAKEILESLLAGNLTEQQAAACRMIGAWRITGLQKEVEELSKSQGPVRAPALAALIRLGNEPPELSANETWPARIAVLEALAESRQKAAGAMAARSLDGINDPEVMRLWLAPIVSRPPAVAAFAETLRSQPCSPEVAKMALTSLTTTGHGDQTLTAALSAIIGVKNTVPSYDPTWVNALAAEVKAQGNIEAGNAVFHAPLSACTGCHQIGKQGGTIGPELDNVGRGVPLELIIEAVVWPNRQIKEGYVATTLTLKDGRRLQGYKISEYNGTLQFRDLASNSLTTYDTKGIKERQEAGSLMPEGLIMNMTRTELRDLIAYLASLGR